MDAEAPLFLVYTSDYGEAQRMPAPHRRLPGLRDGHFQIIQDIHPEDVYWCMGDIGWITAHSYIVYRLWVSRLAATRVVYEGVPIYPDAGRPWRIAERLDVNSF
jgi:acetyl-CoA synthetase